MPAFGPPPRLAALLVLSGWPITSCGSQPALTEATDIKKKTQANSSKPQNFGDDFGDDFEDDFGAVTGPQALALNGRQTAGVSLAVSN